MSFAPRPHVLIQAPYPGLDISPKDTYFFVESIGAHLRECASPELGDGHIPAVLVTTEPDKNLESEVLPILANNKHLSGVLCLAKGSKNNALYFPNNRTPRSYQTKLSELTDSIQAVRHLVIGTSRPKSGSNLSPAALSARLGSQFGVPQPYFQNLALLLVDPNDFDPVYSGRLAASKIYKQSISDIHQATLELAAP